MKTIFRIKKHKENEIPDSWGNGNHCISIYQSNTLGFTWKHLVTYNSRFSGSAWIEDQEKLYQIALKEVENLYKTENCSHKETEIQTVCHTGGEVGKGIICLKCDKLIKYL